MIMYLFTTKTFRGTDTGCELALNTHSLNNHGNIVKFLLKPSKTYVLRIKKKVEVTIKEIL